jgi:hypothetical protein
MCQRCKLLETDDLEASALLLMLIPKIHARCDPDGAMDMHIKLDPTEADWFCAWGAANEDWEEDDPAEHDDPEEASEQLESDFRLEAYKPDNMKPARRIKR